MGFSLILHYYLKQASVLSDLNQWFMFHQQKTSIKKHLQKLKNHWALKSKICISNVSSQNQPTSYT